MLQTFRQIAAFDRPVHVLLANMLVNNVAFYMLVPFLASHFTNTLGIASWMVGLILGLRNLSQQGLFLVGGTLSDRFGYRRIIVIGCILRSVGFGLFGIFDAAAGLAFASFLSGFAAALSTPAGRAYLARESGDRRAEAFAVLGMTLDVGSVLGPLIGALLLGYDFRAVAFTAAGLFLILGYLQYRYLPERDDISPTRRQAVLDDWREVLANRPFVLFSLAMFGYFALINQEYLGIPLEVRRVTGGDASLGALFALSAAIGILGSVPVTSFSKARLGAPRAMQVGMLLLGLAFVPLWLAGPMLPIDTSVVGRLSGGSLAPGLMTDLAVWLVNIAPLAVCISVLTFGALMVHPFAMETVTNFGGERLVGTYIGMYYLGQGLSGALGNAAIGAAFDVAAAQDVHRLPWAVLIVIGFAATAALALLDRRASPAAHLADESA
ncbi:MAG: MFS transporter [Chloroflexota bacterium]